MTSMEASSSSSNPFLPVSVSSISEERQREKERLIKGDDKVFRGSSMTKRGAYAAISYMSCAVLLILFNKAALSSYSFPSANVITLFQMVCSCSLLYVLRRWRIISFTDGGSLTTSDAKANLVPLETLIHTLPLAFTYLLYMVKDVISVGLIVLGAFIAGARDLSFDFYGYAVVFLANFTTAIYLATISRIGKSSGLNSFGLMWCNGR
ncbi:UDP-N-acetylglucosamine transporter UGNT [Salix suchowensis]|nr:UDP-N-acetylglucosamine transporter UGNT [Salix suchowensis]